MGNPGHQLSLLAGCVLCRASLGQKGKSVGTSWVFAGGCMGEKSQPRPLCTEESWRQECGELNVVLGCTPNPGDEGNRHESRLI